MDETNELASFIATTTHGDMPEDEMNHAKLAIRDYLGVAIYGSHHEVGEKIHSHVAAHSSGDNASVLGLESASTTGAALANGTFGHAIDYDDTFETIVIHPTSPVFAAALAATEEADGNGSDLLRGYAVGVETAFRVGHATYPSHYQNGWHSTGTAGSFGAAAAAGSILDLEVEQVEHALGIVASGSSSLKKNFGSMTKPLHAGHAAEIGVRAALLAQDGFTADPAVLEEEMGYGNVMTVEDDYTPDTIIDDLGEEWNINDIGFKPYPSGVITHAAMEAMRSLTLDEDLSSDEVETIRVALDDAASEMLIHAQPSNALQAKFSIEFCLAAILREGDAGIHEFTDEYVQQSETQDVIEKVEREFEENLLGGDFAGYGARVTVETTNETYKKEMKYSPGTPNNPVSDERLNDKFFECASSVVGEEDAEEIADAVSSLEDEGSVDRLLDAASN